MTDITMTQEEVEQNEKLIDGLKLRVRKFEGLNKAAKLILPEIRKNRYLTPETNGLLDTLEEIIDLGESV